MVSSPRTSSLAYETMAGVFSRRHQTPQRPSLLICGSSIRATRDFEETQPLTMPALDRRPITALWASQRQCSILSSVMGLAIAIKSLRLDASGPVFEPR